MFSHLKSIFKVLSVFVVMASMSLTMVIASAQTPAPSGGLNDLTPTLCGSGSKNGIKCSLFENPASASTLLSNRDGILRFILNIASFFIYIASAIAVLFIVWGGYQYITAAGDEGKLKSGKAILINALIGLAICILSITIVTFVSSTLDSNLLSSVAGK